MEYFGHILIGVGNDLLMIGGTDWRNFQTAVWRLSDNNWSQEADLKQKVAYGTAILNGNSIYIVGYGGTSIHSYSQRIDLDENYEIAGVEQIGNHDGEYEWPALFVTSPDYCISSTIDVSTHPTSNLPSETNFVVILHDLADSYITKGDGSETSAVQINAPSNVELYGTQSAFVKGKLHIFGGDINKKKIARLDDCTFVELPHKLNFDAHSPAALSISENSEALICFGFFLSNFKSCDVFSGSSVVSTYFTSYSHRYGGLGFYNGQPITVGSRGLSSLKVETLSSTGWTRLADSPIITNGHILIGLGNGDLLMIGGVLFGKPFKSGQSIWRLSDNNWSQEADLKQKVVYGTAILNGNSIYIVGGFFSFHYNSQRIDLDENYEIAGVEQIGHHDLEDKCSAIFVTSSDFCGSNL